MEMIALAYSPGLIGMYSDPAVHIITVSSSAHSRPISTCTITTINITIRRIIMEDTNMAH